MSRIKWKDEKKKVKWVSKNTKTKQKKKKKIQFAHLEDKVVQVMLGLEDANNNNHNNKKKKKIFD